MFFFFVVITVASQSVLVSRLPLFSVYANTATWKANRRCGNSPYSIENKPAACQEGGRRMWRSRPSPPQKLAGNQTLSSNRYLNWDTEYSLLRPPTLNSVLINSKYACYCGDVTAIEFCKYLQNRSSSNPIKTLPYLKSYVFLDVTHSCSHIFTGFFLRKEVVTTHTVYKKRKALQNLRTPGGPRGVIPLTSRIHVASCSSDQHYFSSTPASVRYASFKCWCNE